MTSPQSSIHVTIEYSRVGETDWLKRRLRADEYFEIPPDGAPIDIDSVPLHSHAVDYLDLEPCDVRVVRLVISGSPNGSSRTITETFWNEGKCRVTERADAGVHSYWELIIESRVTDEPPEWDILRFVRKEGVLVPIYHAIIRENADGSQEENSVLSE